eukprot:TRINITY_DN12567_c0_g1_i5.p1 TRINITY_DN12567_c0_g1~~TRINITY_DN12567_c0_g1_i5.p1  ORF type:complete len:318 (-),score=55.04 TRINITY_DN12567_c0_g1_i5:78-1031(-)
MEEVDTQSEEVAFDKFHEISFKGSPMGATILGPVHNVRHITRDDLRAYVRAHYTASGMVLVVVGDVAHDKTVKLAQQLFEGIPTGEVPEPPAANFHGGIYCGDSPKLLDTNPAAIAKADPTVTVALGTLGVSWSDADFFAFQVLNATLGSWDAMLGGRDYLTSRLCRELGARNLAERLHPFVTCYVNTGLFGVTFAARRSCVRSVCELVMREWAHLTTRGGISSAELGAARARAFAGYALGLGNATQQCDDIGRQLLALNRVMPLAEVWLRFHEEKPSDIRRILRERVLATPPVAVAIGCQSGLPTPEELCQWRTLS